MEERPGWFYLVLSIPVIGAGHWLTRDKGCPLGLFAVKAARLTSGVDLDYLMLPGSIILIPYSNSFFLAPRWREVEKISALFIMLFSSVARFRFLGVFSPAPTWGTETAWLVNCVKCWDHRHAEDLHCWSKTVMMLLRRSSNAEELLKWNM